jgi:hypothetical protein
MNLNSEVIKEYEEWLDENIGEDGREELCRELPMEYDSLFMGYMESQLNGGK